MEELEFSQRIVKILTGKALQDTLRKAGMQGFTVPGFAKNVSQAPPSILAAAMTKRKRGKGFQSGIFLKCLSELDEDILESKLTQKWLEGGVSKEEAERELKDIEISILEKQKQNENVQDGIEIEDSIKTDDKDDTQVIKKQQERIKKLQATIQSYKIANDNYKKEIEQLKRENIKLEAKNAEELRNKTLMEDTIEELNNEIHEQKQKLAKMGTEIEKYKNMYENAPKVLCFSKKEIDKEMFPFYNVEWICEWKNDYVETIDWIKYREVWIAESDFSYSETKTIKNLAKGKVIIARNTNMLITKVGGNN